MQGESNKRQLYNSARKRPPKIRKTVLATVCCVAAALFVLVTLPTYATGFGWYAILFDYEKFESDYDADLDRTLTLDEADMYGERVRDARRTDGAVFDYIEVNSEEYGVEYPESFELELMWHSALMAIVGRVRQTHPDTPLRFLTTGRRFLGPGNMPSCEENFELIWGSCRTFIMFTREETETVFWQLTEIVDADPSFREPLYLEELEQLRNIFKEATLKNKAVYIYGHD